MSHTHAWVLVHCVFSTKERANLIPDPVEMCRYLTGVARAKNVTLLAAGCPVQAKLERVFLTV